MVHETPGRIGLMPQNKYRVRFGGVSEFDGPVSKIGGGPNWLNGDAWPKDCVEPASMYFFCQIELDDFIFPQRKSDMAYVFIGSKLNRYRLCENNAVVFQSRGRSDSKLETPDSPELHRRLRYLDEPDVEPQFGRSLHCEPTIENPSNFDSEVWHEEYWNAMTSPQIGGLPFFDPVDIAEARSVLGEIEKWRLLFFVNCDDEFPFLVPDGSPTYYVFTNDECTVGHVVGMSRI
jgi:uncharacterized protein YwqG